MDLSGGWKICLLGAYTCWMLGPPLKGTTVTLIPSKACARQCSGLLQVPDLNSAHFSSPEFYSFGYSFNRC